MANAGDSITKVAAVEFIQNRLPTLSTISPETDSMHCSVLLNTTVNGLNYVWTFGDLDSSTSKDPTHQYNGEGPYEDAVLRGQ